MPLPILDKFVAGQKDGILTYTDSAFDKVFNKFQSEINESFKSSIENLNNSSIKDVKNIVVTPTITTDENKATISINIRLTGENNTTILENTNSIDIPLANDDNAGIVSAIEHFNIGLIPNLIAGVKYEVTGSDIYVILNDSIGNRPPITFPIASNKSAGAITATMFNKLNNSYTKPSTGIPLSDLSQNLQDKINNLQPGGGESTNSDFDYNGFEAFYENNNGVVIKYKGEESFVIAPADEEECGVMSSTDKKKLNNTPKFINLATQGNTLIPIEELFIPCFVMDDAIPYVSNSNILIMSETGGNCRIDRYVDFRNGSCGIFSIMELSEEGYILRGFIDTTISWELYDIYYNRVNGDANHLFFNDETFNSYNARTWKDIVTNRFGIFNITDVNKSYNATSIDVSYLGEEFITIPVVNTDEDKAGLITSQDKIKLDSSISKGLFTIDSNNNKVYFTNYKNNGEKIVSEVPIANTSHNGFMTVEDYIYIHGLENSLDVRFTGIRTTVVSLQQDINRCISKTIDSVDAYSDVDGYRIDIDNESGNSVLNILIDKASESKNGVMTREQVVSLNKVIEDVQNINEGNSNFNETANTILEAKSEFDATLERLGSNSANAEIAALYAMFAELKRSIPFVNVKEEGFYIIDSNNNIGMKLSSECFETKDTMYYKKI